MYFNIYLKLANLLLIIILISVALVFSSCMNSREPTRGNVAVMDETNGQFIEVIDANYIWRDGRFLAMVYKNDRGEYVLYTPKRFFIIE